MVECLSQVGGFVGGGGAISTTHWFVSGELQLARVRHCSRQQVVSNVSTPFLFLLLHPPEKLQLVCKTHNQLWCPQHSSESLLHYALYLPPHIQYREKISMEAQQYMWLSYHGFIIVELAITYCRKQAPFVIANHAKKFD